MKIFLQNQQFTAIESFLHKVVLFKKKKLYTSYQTKLQLNKIQNNFSNTRYQRI